MMKAPGILLLAFLATSALAAESTTAPSSDDAPAPVAMAPTYIAVGKELLLRVAIVRRTLDDLNLATAVHQQAMGILDHAERNLRQLLANVECGNMPTYGTIMAVPQDMRTIHQNLLTALGPDKAQLLEEKLRSLRGEARGEIAKIRQELEDRHLSSKAKCSCDVALSQADKAVENLPDCDVEGDQYAADRQAMDHVVGKARADVANALTPVEQTKLDPATRPSPRS